MAVIATILMCIGVLIALVYGIQLLIMAFRESILWGLGYIFIPLVGLIFVIMHWNETKTPFLRGLLALPFMILGVMLMPQSPTV
jgi:hypothetical protein